MMPDLATAAGLVVGVVVTAFAALTVLGVVLLSRRARREALAPPPGTTDAGVALVRADTALRDGIDELGYAVAQFGEDRTREFSAALDAARADLDRAFRLQQQLDDAYADSERQRREWTRDIAAIASRVSQTVSAQTQQFAHLRRSEADAPETIAKLRRNLAATRDRRAGSAGTFAELTKAYTDATIAVVAGNLDGADAALGRAEAALDAADAGVATKASVTDQLAAAESGLHEATQLLDAIDRRRDELAKAVAGIEAIRTEETASLEAARALRDAPPDPDSGAAVNEAIAALEAKLTEVARKGRRDPVADLDALVDASDKLDIAVAAARNQQRRLDGARSALAGALVSARTQLAAVSDYIGSHGGGADARTRLAEGQRNLLLAENEADPVEALDAARRAQTNARDADALARY
jgi:predicted  nucleic acid-binding Zn-ribbon protein